MTRANSTELSLARPLALDSASLDKVTFFPVVWPGADSADAAAAAAADADATRQRPIVAVVELTKLQFARRECRGKRALRLTLAGGRSVGRSKNELKRRRAGDGLQLANADALMQICSGNNDNNNSDDDDEKEED